VSQENVESLRRGFDAMNRGDLSRILAFVHPDFETVIPPELSAEPSVYRGHDGVRRYFDSFSDAMRDIRFNADDIWDVGDAVVVALRLTARGKETGIAVEQQVGQVWTIRDGMAVRLENFVTVSQALESVGHPRPGPAAPS
jgi:ketosteroid isomerase-like protein